MSPSHTAEGLAFDPFSLLSGSSPPMFVLSLLLLAASAGVWFIVVVKARQLSRWRRAELAFRRGLPGARTPSALESQLRLHAGSFGARLASELVKTRGDPVLIDAVTDHAIARYQRRTFALMTVLASIATASPLAGLFGTVYGIMEAFSKIGQEKSASLPVVAPAIGDALMTTALGLLAAIPAVIAYNLLTRRLEDFLEDVRTFLRAWARGSDARALLTELDV